MSASQQALRIEVSDGAGGFDIHIAAHQDGADGGAGFKRFRLLIVALPSLHPLPG